jgi:hypothetical protein
MMSQTTTLTMVLEVQSVLRVLRASQGHQAARQECGLMFRLHAIAANLVMLAV